MIFFFQAEDGIRDVAVTGVQTCALPIFEIVVPSSSILAQPPVAMVDKNVDDHGTRKVAEAYLQFLYSPEAQEDRKSTRLNSSHGYISYAVFCLKKKNPTGRDS